METRQAPGLTRTQSFLMEALWHLSKWLGLTGWLCSSPLKRLLQVVATSKQPQLKQGRVRANEIIRGSLLNGFK